MTATGEPAALPKRFRWPGPALRELHYRLRSEGDSPARRGAAVALGTFIGCLPLYGAHFLLCTVAARLLRLNRLMAYLASYINNPLTAPFILALSYGIGHRLTRGDWPRLDAHQIASLGLLGLGRDLMTGGAALGLLLGAVLGTAAWGVSLGRNRPGRWQQLFDATGRRYEPAGVFHWEFVRGKLRYDPMYRALAERPELRGTGTILDLGCGRGMALALADAARQEQATHGLESGGKLIGVEVRPEMADVARAALGPGVLIETVDLAEYRPPPADLILLLDVLHYLETGTQDRLLSALSTILRPGGVILVREPDAGLGVRFWLTRAAERLCALARGHWRQRFHYRTAADWGQALQNHGLGVSITPMRNSTPYANVMIEARRRP